jgi:zinc protease
MMSSTVLICFAVALLNACATKKAGISAPPQSQQGALDEVLVVDPMVVTGTLPNGFRYVIRANEKPENRAELRLVVNVGSVLETEEEQGLAHFAEHMAFNGTRNFAKQELVDYLQSIGMRFGPDLNAYTGFDETVYMLTVPTDSTKFMEQGFQILEDWAHGVTFDGMEIDKERGVVIEEWRLGKGADQRMWDKLWPVLLKDSRYAVRLPIGQKAVLDTFHHETLRNFYSKWYRPGLMGLVAVGDFEVSWIEDLIQIHFSRRASAPSPAERVVYPVPDHGETLFSVATDPEATRNAVSIYYKRDPRDQSTVAAYRAGLIESLYHRMFNQRLYELTQLAEPPFLYGYSSQGRWLRSKEFFILGAGVPDNGFGLGLEALLTEAARARQFGFTASELRRNAEEMLRAMEQAFRERDKSPSSSFASEYVNHLLENEPIPGIEKEYELLRQLLPGIALQEVNALTASWGGERNRVISIGAPDKEGLRVPTEEGLLAVFAAVDEKRIEPYVEDISDQPLVADLPPMVDIVERHEIAEIGVTTWTLANGIRVVLKPTDFQNDQILFESFSLGGNSLVGDRDYIAASTATSVVTQGGVGDYNLVDLQKKLAGKVVSVFPWIGSLREGISGSASPEDVETMFQLIYAYVAAPRPDSTAFQAYETRMRGFIENRSARPETAFGDTVQVTLAQYHHRARPWSLDLIDEMNLSTSMAIYQDRFSDMGDFTFYFVGNFTLEQLEPLVRTYLGALPATDRRESWKDVGETTPRGVIEKTVRRGIEPKSRTLLAFSGPYEFDGWRNDFVLDAMSEVLHIKLREVLREDLGGTYSVSVNGGGSHFPKSTYMISLSFGCDPDRVEELTAVVFAQIDSLKGAGPGHEDMQKVREAAKRSHEVNLKENSYWRGALSASDFHNLDPTRVLRYTAMVDSLTPGEVQAAAKRYLDMENYVRVVLLPEEDSEPE